MSTVSEILVTPLSGLNHIDALLDKGPDWNYVTGTANTIFYTFSISSGNEQGKVGQEAFSFSQQAAARTAFSYLQKITGISFVETNSGDAAHIHLCNIDIENPFTSGLCSWNASYEYSGTTLHKYNVDAYVYLDNDASFRAQNQNLAPGGAGYETLLHELGHALGLKHPFESAEENPAVLSTSEDHTGNTLLSYSSQGGPHSEFSSYDIAALNWLYGGDGLGGALGINSTTGGRYITGTSRADTLTGTHNNDTLQGNGGNDMIDGGEGKDTAILNGNRMAYTFANLPDGALRVTSAAEGVTTLRSVETLQFADMSVERANLVDITPPAAPLMAVTQNAKLYARGNTPVMTGSAEANSTVRVFIDDRLAATVTADADGLWSVKSALALPDGLNYRAHATATDATGNTSAASTPVVFHIDATAPSVPTVGATMNSGGNQPVYSGTGEAGTTIDLYRDGDFIKLGSTVVGSDGKWQFNAQPLPNDTYTVLVASLDLAGNATSSGNSVTVAVNNIANKTGTAEADTFIMAPENAAIDGGAGIDIAVFNGAHADYTIAQGSFGFTVSDRNGGVDGLYNVERLQFSDSWYAIDEATAQLYRLYRAALGRDAEPTGLGYWMDRVDKGTPLLRVAHEFTWQPEFDEKYGVNPSNEVFLTKLYANVLNRLPDAEGFAYWMIRLNGGDDMIREKVMVEFSESLENKAQVLPKTSDGMEFIPWVQPVSSVQIIGTDVTGIEAPAWIG